MPEIVNTPSVDLYSAALCAWREASGEGEQGMRAVLHVIKNRSAKWGKSVLGVVTQPKQFTSMTVRGDANTVRWPADADAAWAKALELAESVLSGEDDDITNGGLYYDNPALATSSWFQQNVVSCPKWHPQTAVIGNHKFYA